MWKRRHFRWNSKGGRVFPQFSELGTSRKGLSDEGESVRSKDRVEKGPADGLEGALFEYQKEREKGCVIYGGGESTIRFMRVHMESNKKETNISNIPQSFSRRLQR